MNGYLKQLDQHSDKVSIEESGYSHEGRQQLTAVISSPDNLANIDTILSARKQVKAGEVVSGPLIIWLAYSIHGDEASGAHAALATAYYLAASQDQWIEDALNQAIILITPSQNPDGMDRFANWVNSNRGYSLVTDPQSREHQQDWPSGRGNHFFADLNRDWLFARHPESQGRVALFHRWQPHYVGDFHEMGTNSSYFFQPGVPERNHPLTPKRNHQLTQELAKFHQQALDNQGQSYFSEQLFDDFFYGKGSTYPDINGAVGILFEQASARGHAQASTEGGISLVQAINNQFTTSLSSVKGALALKKQLIDYQHEFFNQQKKQKQPAAPKGLLVSANQDPARLEQLVQLLRQHQVNSFVLNKSVKASGRIWQPQDSIFIPLNQAQQSLIQALFDNRKQFEDTSFYDISSWDLRLAFNLTVSDETEVSQSKLRAYSTLHFFDARQAEIPATALAVIIDWRQTTAPAMLSELLQQDILVKFAASPFTLNNGKTAQQFVAGSLQIPLRQAKKNRQSIVQTLTSLARQHRVALYSATSSASVQGIDLGSPDFKTIQPVRPLLISGEGTVASEVGEIWRYVDHQLQIPISLSNSQRLRQLSLAPYTHIIFAGGDYNHLNEVVARKLGQFVTKGGVIIAQKGALSWLNKRHLLQTDVRTPRYFEKLVSGVGLTYAEKKRIEGQKQIGGAILKLALDEGHPLSFGTGEQHLSVLKDEAIGLSHANIEPFVTAASYADDILESGYLTSEYQRELSGTPAFIWETKGKGAIIGFTDNLLFRSFWLATEKVYANALFFSGMATPTYNRRHD
ncbi:peptidase M14 [Shewanella gelidii]|uniref:Peptidase M14 n=1 Tax=Shewanella gelidii TaxID=1642821 RepID=A0A917JQP0_9GAMM|nr:peptidase M14 [Shewanella gelidii]